MKQKTPNIKGMNFPILIWLYGFFHGRFFKTAGIDEKTGYVCSGYITKKSKLFNSFSSVRVEELEQELKAVRSEALDLIVEHAQIRKNLDEDNYSSIINRKRAINRSASIVQRLGEIDSKIRSSELHAREELDATASALQSVFSVYADGMLFRPVQSKFIPPVEYRFSFDMYEESHKNEDKQIRHILKGVYNYDQDK